MDGLVFGAGFGAYTVARQILFPWRTVPRKISHGLRVTLTLACAAVLVAGVVLVVS